jgi:hypothetical protein
MLSSIKSKLLTLLELKLDSWVIQPIANLYSDCNVMVPLLLQAQIKLMIMFSSTELIMALVCNHIQIKVGFMDSTSLAMRPSVLCHIQHVCAFSLFCMVSFPELCNKFSWWVPLALLRVIVTVVALFKSAFSSCSLQYGYNSVQICFCNEVTLSHNHYYSAFYSK